ncbi:hypothetical protein CR513_45637, partial [Mucuna pruriens]
MKSSRPDRLHLDQSRLLGLADSFSGELCTFQVPLEFIFSYLHYFHSLALISYAYGGARCYHWCFSRSRKCKSRIEKPKIARGNRLDYQRTLVDLILSVLASEGEPLPSTMVIVVEDGVTKSRPCSETESIRLCSVRLHLVETVSDKACRVHIEPVSAEIVSDKALPSPYQTSLYRERVGTLYSRVSVLLWFSYKITIEHTVSLRKFDLRSSTDPLYNLDLELELTLHRLRKARKIVVAPVLPLTLTSFLLIFPFHFVEPGQMENNDKTLKELTTPDVVYQPWCIQYPQLEPTQTYELKSGLIHLLPKFHGLAGEDPHKHLKEFNMVCSTMRS